MVIIEHSRLDRSFGGWLPPTHARTRLYIQYKREGLTDYREYVRSRHQGFGLRQVLDWPGHAILSAGNRARREIYSLGGVYRLRILLDSVSLESSVSGRRYPRAAGHDRTRESHGLRAWCGEGLTFQNASGLHADATVVRLAA